jgi:hypothetical protein
MKSFRFRQRRHQERCVLAKRWWNSPILDIDGDEILGLLNSLNKVHELQLKNVDFELDTQTS